MFPINMIAQDGSDIKYVSVSHLDNSYIEKLVHLDFYNRSFNVLTFGDKVLTDTVTIELESKGIEFSEHRVDNGLNNWFSEQYLESTEFIDSYKIRVTMCQIKEINSDFIKVMLFLEYRDKNGQLNSKKSNRVAYRFSKKILTKILVRN